MLKPPCKDCEQRNVTCHSTCEAYKAYRAQQDASYVAKRLGEAAIAKTATCARDMSTGQKYTKGRGRRYK